MFPWELLLITEIGDVISLSFTALLCSSSVYIRLKKHEVLLRGSRELSTRKSQKYGFALTATSPMI